jgi:hypothetical protein
MGDEASRYDELYAAIDDLHTKYCILSECTPDREIADDRHTAGIICNEYFGFRAELNEILERFKEQP